MTIAVNCWTLRNKNIDGIGNVIIESMRPMIQQHPETHFMMLCDKNFTEDYFSFPNVSIHRIFPPYRHPLLYILHMEWTLTRFLNKHQPNVFVGMDGMISLSYSGKQIALIHDLNFEHYPETLPLRNRLYYRYFFKKFAHKADKIVAVSKYTKNDIITTYNVDRTKIDVITLGAKKIFQPLSTDRITSTRQQYTKGQPYFFFVGSMHARKNILRLMQAFDLFKQATGSPLQLMLAGNILWEADEIKQVYQQLIFKEDIIFPGRVNDDELAALLGSAYALAFVPLFEGFGLPIVEAFRAGIPVICSNTSSMPEVAGDAALLVDPLDVHSIKKAMIQLATDNTLYQNLQQKGLERSVLFEWEKTSQDLWYSITQI